MSNGDKLIIAVCKIAGAAFLLGVVVAMLLIG